MSQAIEIQGLQNFAHFHNDEAVISSKLLDLFPSPEMIVHAVSLPGPRAPRGVKGEAAKTLVELGIQSCERPVQRTLPNTRRAGQNYQASHRMIT
jgi:hypothetical protein